MKKTLLERFLDYTRMETTSSETSGTHPSSPGQRVLAEKLAEELRELGAERVRVTEHAYVFAEVPPSPGCGEAPVLGFLAHMDTSPEASGRNVRPRVVKYRGGAIPLGTGGRVLDPEVFPCLGEVVGHTLVTTDGSTLLGADDKAGIAEIMTALERILSEGIPHGPLRIGFTPDEEIGEGTLFFPVGEFGADCAYTMDGGGADEIEYQNFNAASVEIRIEGVSVHPGSAKGIMKNAARIAMELDSKLPANEVPEKTEGFEGFHHLTRMDGTVSEARLSYLLRDHDEAKFAAKKKDVLRVAEELNRKYGAGTVRTEIRDQYRNMEEIIRENMFLIEIAESAVRAAGGHPRTVPIRGGTDGAALSRKGLPCPNLGTGGYQYHGEYEFASLEEMTRAAEVISGIVRSFSSLRRG